MSIFDNIQEFETSKIFREKIGSYCIIKKFKADEVILRENSYISAIPIVSKGSIKVMRTDEDGREILLYYIKAGESCIMSFLGGMHNETSKIQAVCEEESEIYFLPIEKLTSLMKDHHEILDYIFKLYHRRFEELLDVVNAIAFKKMDERIFDFLKKKSEVTHTKEFHITHEQIANELGTARVVVSRILKQMESTGQITLGRNKITIL
ncbi:MAG: Crp/Fnr family transcriptional regulator [Candidatus Kapabacteria bacterium]|nr:Crp/Fnr family transcriptional regulator [Candidatus Kapabacteria bacterium]